MHVSLDDDTPLRRRVIAVQLGLLLALVVTVVGQAYGLSTAISTQVPLILASVGAALLVEHALRPVRGRDRADVRAFTENR